MTDKQRRVGRRFVNVWGILFFLIPCSPKRNPPGRKLIFRIILREASSLMRSWDTRKLVTRYWSFDEKLVFRLFAWIRLKRLDFKNSSRTKWHVFFAVLGQKQLQSNQSPWTLSLTSANTLPSNTSFRIPQCNQRTVNARGLSIRNSPITDFG